MNLDLRIWAYTALSDERKPWARIGRQGGINLNGGMLGRQFELAICRPHSTMAHSVDEGRDCCRGRRREPLAIELNNQTGHDLMLTELTMQGDGTLRVTLEADPSPPRPAITVSFAPSPPKPKHPLPPDRWPN